MKRNLSLAVGAALIAVGCFTVALADEQAPPTNERGIDVQVEAKKPVLSDNVNRPQTQQAIGRRASEIQGMTIKNDMGKDLGAVRDVVVDTKTGKVKYAAVAYGGFLGLGSKLFAVPFEAFDYRPESQDDDSVLLLNLSEETLRNAPGFDSDNWPNMADKKFTSAVDTHYRANRPMADATNEGVKVDVGDVNVDVNVKRDESVDEAQRERIADTDTKSLHVLRADDIMGMEVVNKANEDVGSINDLMIDMGTGEVRYVALSVGGLAGIGDSLHAIAWDKFQLSQNADNNEQQFVLNMDAKMLEDARGFDQNNWPQRAGDTLQQNRDANTTGPNLDTRIDGSNTGVGANVESDVNQ